MKQHRSFTRGIILGWLTTTLLVGSSPYGLIWGADPSSSKVLMYEEPRFLTGAIYARSPSLGPVLFNFRRESHRWGNTLDVQRVFSYPDGRVAASEHVVYDGDKLVLFEFKELQIGTEGRARILRAPGDPTRGTIEFQFIREPNAKPKTRSEPLTDTTLVNDMVAPFLTSHWDALMRGEKVSCRFIVTSRRETVGFTFVKDSESTWQGRAVVIIKMQPTSLFVSALVSPLFFTIEKAAPRHILQYVGRTSPKIRVGDKWKDLDAVTVFDWASAR